MKRIFTALCCAVLLLCGSTSTVLAAEQQTCDNPTPPVTTAPVEPDPVPLYPAEVNQSEENGVTRIEKVYYLTAQDDPADIPTEDFERDGQHFTLQDVLKNSQMERDTKDHVEEVTVNSAKKDMESILPLLEPEIEVQTEDGYDMALRYTATATYTGTATSQYATGYVVTASYHGAVTRVNCDVITYTAIFSSTDPAPTLPAEEDATLTDTPTQAEPQPDAEAAQESTEEGFSFPWALLLLPVALAGLGAAGYFGYKQYRHYINKKRGYE